MWGVYAWQRIFPLIFSLKPKGKPASGFYTIQYIVC